MRVKSAIVGSAVVVGAAVLAAAVLGVLMVLADGPESGAAPPAVSELGSDRDAVIAGFADIVVPAFATPWEWTGNTKQCDPGTVSPAFLDASLRVMNYLRALAGVEEVTLNANMSEDAQRIALLRSANMTRDSWPQPTWRCAKEAGPVPDLGSGDDGFANITATPGVEGLLLYMRDHGAGNADVSHRRKVLSPWQREVGLASTDETHAMYQHVPILESLPGATPPSVWPTAGYFPEGLYPGSPHDTSGGNGRWSVTTHDLPGDRATDLADAQVMVVQTAPRRRTLAVDIERTEDAFERGIVFTPRGVSLPDDVGGDDTTYEVTISSVTDKAGNPLPDITYSTTFVASPELRHRTWRRTGALHVRGAVRVGGWLVARVIRVDPTPERVTYQWLRDGRPIAGAQGSRYAITGSDEGHRISVRATVFHPGLQVHRFTVGTGRIPADAR